jgi:hypothetical protein
MYVGGYELSDFLAAQGVQLFYSFFYDFGVPGFVISNLLLICIGIFVYGLRGLYIPFLTCPHYIQLVILPSKDLIVLYFYIATISCLVSSRFKSAIIISLLSYFVRDAAPVILLSIVTASYLICTKKINTYKFVIYFFLSCQIGFLLLDFISEHIYIFAFERNKLSFETVSSGYFKEVPYFLAYIFRIFFNLTNMAFRLPFIDDLGLLSVASCFFYFSGLSNLICLVLSSKFLSSHDLKLKFISVSYYVSIFIISLNPFVQGRYQLPMVIICGLYFFKKYTLGRIFRFYLYAMICSILGRSIYFILGIPFPDLVSFSFNLIDLESL